MAADGDTFEAEDFTCGETVASAYADFPNHFGFFLPLAGITTDKQVRNSSFDNRASDRLNQLYRTSEGQSRMGHGRAPPRQESFHGAVAGSNVPSFPNFGPRYSDRPKRVLRAQ
jgi:restriction-modification enzyme MmeI-like protein